MPSWPPEVWEKVAAIFQAQAQEDAESIQVKGTLELLEDLEGEPDGPQT